VQLSSSIQEIRFEILIDLKFKTTAQLSNTYQIFNYHQSIRPIMWLKGVVNVAKLQMKFENSF